MIDFRVLKQKIIDLGVSGKLATFDNNDEPVNVLINNLSKNYEIKVLIKQDNYYVDSETDEADENLYDIPSNWTWVRLSSLATFSGGFAFKSEQFKKEGVRVIRISDFDENGLNNKSIVYHCELKNMDSFTVMNNDILMAMTGGTVGKTCVVKNLESLHYLNQRVCRIRVSPLVCLEYIYYAVSSSLVKNIIQTEKNSTNDNISMDTIKNFPIPLPPLKEQIRITNKINELLLIAENIHNKSANISKYKELAKEKILDLAIFGKLTKNYCSESATITYENILAKQNALIKNKDIKPIKGILPIDDEELPFEIPENWIWTRLGHLVEVITDGTHKTPCYVPSGIKFLSVQNISHGYFDFTNVKYITLDEHQLLCKRVEPKQNDLLICRIGTLGKAIKINFVPEFSIFVSLGLIRFVDYRLADYIMYVFNSSYGKQWILDNRVGGGTHTYKINLESFPNMLIPLPPINEIESIIKKVNNLLDFINKL